MENHPEKGKVQKTLWVFSIIIAYAGLVGFSCFIFEESLQLQSFTAFMYVNSEDWNGLAKHVELMERTQGFAEAWIKGIGWSNPVMWPAFLSYLNSNKAHIKALKERLRAEGR
jgi:hypothetical protein